MSTFDKMLEDILAQYRRIGFQTQVWRQKENEEVFVTLRLGRVKASMIISMVGVSAVASILLMAGCNKQVIDLTYEYSQAQIKMPDGTVVEGKVDSWNDYEGDQLQVKINGTTYLVHSSNVILWH